jgi:DNA-binding XRE family transcriptional regulator
MGQAPTAAQVPAEARALAALWTEDPDVRVRVSYRVPETIRQAIEQAAAREQAGREALNEAATLRRQAAKQLTSKGMTQADAAAVLGVSRQRVQQLVA